MTSISGTDTATNIVEEESSDNTYLLYMTQKCLTSTPRITKMKLLQLYKLSKLSGRLSVKLYLIKTFLPTAKDILNNESSQYAKDKLLEIIASTCYFDEAIEMIGKDNELVDYIFRCFSTCNNNLRLQKTLFKFLSLIACEIQFNSESEWTYHLINSHNYFLGPNILRIITQYNAEITNKRLLTNSSLMEILSFLELLSELIMPDSTNGLEHLFKIDDLVFALLIWYSKGFVRNCYRFYFNNDHYFWVVTEKWMKIITVITKLHSFRCDSCNSDTDLYRACILAVVSFVHNWFRATFYCQELLDSPIGSESFLSLVTAPNIGAMYRSITAVLWSFPGYELFLQSIDSIIDIADKVRVFLKFETLESETITTRRSLQILFTTLQYLYILLRTRKWSSKNILELVLLWHGVLLYYESFTDMYNFIRRKLHFACVYCWTEKYLLPDNSALDPLPG